MIVIQLSPDDLRSLIREEISTAIRSQPEVTFTRKEAAKFLRKSVQTIKRMQDRGEIRPLHPAGHPTYSKSELVKNGL